MHEGNYQQLYHIFINLCRGKEQTLTFHHFLELFYCTFFESHIESYIKSYMKSYIITKGNRMFIYFLDIS